MGNHLGIEVEYWYKENNLCYIGNCVHYDVGHEVRWIIGKPVVTPIKSDTCLKVIINMQSCIVAVQKFTNWM
jgi:hypothetical protein